MVYFATYWENAILTFICIDKGGLLKTSLTGNLFPVFQAFGESELEFKKWTNFIPRVPPTLSWALSIANLSTWDYTEGKTHKVTNSIVKKLNVVGKKTSYSRVAFWMLGYTTVHVETSLIKKKRRVRKELSSVTSQTINLSNNGIWRYIRIERT